MAQYHVAEKPMLQGLVGGLFFGGDQGLLLNADLAPASTPATVKALVDPRVAKLHTSQKTFGPRVLASINQINSYDATYFGGSLVQKPTMLALSVPPYRGRAMRF